MPRPGPDAASGLDASGAPAREAAAQRSPDELLRLVGRGDEQAFAALYDALAPRVYGLARRVVRDPAQAEEVAQEALVEVWRSAARFDPRARRRPGC